MGLETKGSNIITDFLDHIFHPKSRRDMISPPFLGMDINFGSDDDPDRGDCIVEKNEQFTPNISEILLSGRSLDNDPGACSDSTRGDLYSAQTSGSSA